jgi:6-phosphofructokinase
MWQHHILLHMAATTPAAAFGRLHLCPSQVEASSARNGIGLVKLMGRQSGFIAVQASMASGGGRGSVSGRQTRTAQHLQLIGTSLAADCD